MNLSTVTVQFAELLTQLKPEALPHLRLDLTFRLEDATLLPECVRRTGLPGLLKLIQARAGAEIGVQRGEFSVYLLENWPGKLWLVDPWQRQEETYVDVANVDNAEHEANYQATLTAVASFAGRYDIIRGCSVCAAPFFDDNFLDFVFIDANHSYEAVAQDLAAWTPKVRPGGIISGHDFMDYDGPLGEFRVRSAVLDYAARYNLEVYASQEPWPSLWYFVKPGLELRPYFETSV